MNENRWQKPKGAKRIFDDSEDLTALKSELIALFINSPRPKIDPKAEKRIRTSINRINMKRTTSKR